MAGVLHSWCRVHFLLHHSRRQTMPDCPAVTNDKFDGRVKAMTARSPHGVAVLPPPPTAQVVCGGTRGSPCGHPVPHPLPSDGFSIHGGHWPETPFSLRAAKRPCPNCVTLSTFLSGRPSTKKSFCSARGSPGVLWSMIPSEGPGSRLVLSL